MRGNIRILLSFVGLFEMKVTAQPWQKMDEKFWVNNEYCISEESSSPLEPKGLSCFYNLGSTFESVDSLSSSN